MSTDNRCLPSSLVTFLGVSAAGALVLSGCAVSGASDAEEAVTLTGSSTIGPIAVIASRESGIETSVETVGTNEGFERFCSGEADINNASAPIPGPEGAEDYQQQCADNGVDYVELAIGIDAISLVRNEEADFVDDLSMEELAALWEPDSEVRTWSDLRSEWPDEDVILYGRDADSGTFTVFTEEVMGSVGEIREDYEYTNDLAELAGWVAEEPHALAFMGIGNYLSAEEEDRDRITTLTLDGVAADAVSSADGDYPLARELYVYVSVEAIEENEEVEAYAAHLLENGRSILPRAFFYPLNESAYQEQLQQLEERATGTDAE